MFITFEGIDGCGKTTQMEKSTQFLRNLNHEVTVTREPGGTKFAEQLREILLHSSDDITPMSELFLFEAARSQLVEKIIRPALNENKFIISDRFYDSTTAYQGYGRGLSVNDIICLNRIATNGIIPDITFFLDVSMENSFKRRGKEQDRIESLNVDFFENVAAGYRAMAAQEPNRIHVIDSNLSKEETFSHIKEIIINKLQDLKFSY